MSRITLKVDSATTEEVFDLTLAFQRTAQLHQLPPQITKQPVVSVCGIAMGWETPALTPEHARALLAEMQELQELTR